MKKFVSKVFNVALSLVLVTGLLPTVSWADDSAGDSSVASAQTQSELLEPSTLTAQSDSSPIKQITVGSAEQSVNTVPYANTYKNSGMQTIYTASEIGTSGTISSIAFDVAATGQYSISSIQVYMGTTTSASFSSATAFGTDDLTLVYSSANVVGIATGLEELELDTPFEYDGTSNLIVAVYHQATSYKSSLKYKASSVSNSVLLRTNDSDSTYGTLAGEGAYSVQSVRPDVTLTINTCKHENLTLIEQQIPNCITGGYDIYKCNDCGLMLTRNVQPATGIHEYVGGICKYCGFVKDYYAVLYGTDTLVFQHEQTAISDYGAAIQTWELTPTDSYSSASATPWASYATQITTVKMLEGAAPHNMAYWFSGMTALESVDLSGIDASGLTNAEHMFDGCASIKALDLTPLGGGSDRLVAMAYMLNGCASLESITAPRATVSSIASMFKGCSALKSLDLASLNTSEATSMRDLFYGCSALSEVDLSSFDTAKVTDMAGMFCNCASLVELDLSSFVSTSLKRVGRAAQSSGLTYSTDTASGMFQRCSSLKTIYTSPEFIVTSGMVSSPVVVDNPNGTTSTYYYYRDYYMFDGCSSLVGGAGTVYSSSHARSTYARVDSVNTPGYFTQSCAPGGHNIQPITDKAATCTEDGSHGGTYCTICNRIFEQPEVLPALGHSLQAFVAQAATCTEAGHAAYWYCGTCKKYFSNSYATSEIADITVWLAEGGAGYVASTGVHNFDETTGICSMCSSQEHVIEYIAAKAYRVIYLPNQTITEGCATYNGKAMSWMTGEQCWAIVLDSKPDSLNSVFSVNSEATVDVIDTTGTAEEKIISRGDLNDNGSFNIVDAQIAYDLATGAYRASDYSSMALRADVNKDNIVDAADARAIQVAILKQ